MAIGIVGRKAGMTRIFSEDGVSTPVTVIEVEPNRVTKVATDETDGYSSIQVTTGSKKASRVNKPEAGHFAGISDGMLDRQQVTDLLALLRGEPLTDAEISEMCSILDPDYTDSIGFIEFQDYYLYNS